MPTPNKKVKPAVKGPPPKPQSKPVAKKPMPQHTTAQGMKDICWFYKELFDAFGVDHKALPNEASVLNMIAAKLSDADCTLLLRAVRALKNEGS